MRNTSIIPPVDPERARKEQTAHDKAQMLFDIIGARDREAGAALAAPFRKPVTEGDTK